MLIKRFKETRRKHPLAPSSLVSEGIKEERNKLKTIKEMADNIIDTSGLKPKELKEEIVKVYRDKENKAKCLSIYYPLALNMDTFGRRSYFDVHFCQILFISKFTTPIRKDKEVKEYVLGFQKQWNSLIS